MDENLSSLVTAMINIRETRDARLAFEALKLLGAMICHKKFVIDFVSAQRGIQTLLEIPRPSIASTAVSQCLYYIACDDDGMEKVCHLPHKVLARLVQ